MPLRKLNLPLKVLFTCFLLTMGIAYLFAVLYLYLMDVEPHARKGDGLVQAVILKYYGQRGGTRLEAALEGGMGENISAPQKMEIFQWIRKGASADGFPRVQPIFLNHCAPCHSKESGMQIPPLTTYEEVSEYTKVDMGQSVKSLVRVSHIHLFGMSFIFLLTSGIFSMSEIDRRWRAVLVAVPFVAIWVDIGSWWFTRWKPLFAYTVVVGGILMGISLAAQILMSIYEMWLKPVSDERGGPP
jgi:hypothetical protein